VEFESEVPEVSTTWLSMKKLTSVASLTPAMRDVAVVLTSNTVFEEGLGAEGGERD